MTGKTTTPSNASISSTAATTPVEPVVRESSEWRDVNKAFFYDRIRVSDELEMLRDTTDGDESVVQKRRIARKEREFETVTNQIIDYNFGLVRKYVRRFTGSATSDDAKDFEASGVLGLMKAIDSYDPDRGSFAQWAFKPIQREVLRAVHAADHSNMTSGDFERRPSILTALRKLQDGDDNVRPAYDAIAEEAGVTIKQVRRVLDAPRIQSMHTPVGDGETTLGELVEDAGDLIDDQVISAQNVADLKTYGLVSLDTRELFVLTRRLGLDCEPEQRLSAIGEMLSLSREAVRQIESKAVAKMSHPVLMRRLARNGRE